MLITRNVICENVYSTCGCMVDASGLIYRTYMNIHPPYMSVSIAYVCSLVDVLVSDNDV